MGVEGALWVGAEGVEEGLDVVLVLGLVVMRERLEPEVGL